MDTFVDVEEKIAEEGVQPEGSVYTTFGSVAVGNGSNVFRADQSGIWLGASEWADAPFRVDMAGNLTASSANLTGTGYSKTVTFAQDAIPTSVAIGDLWVDTNDNNALYRAASVGATTIAAGAWVAFPDEYKLDIVGGTYVTTLTAAAGKVQIFPDANTGIVAYAGNGTSVVFKVVVDGTDVGDVSLGDYAGGKGVLWDQSASTFTIKGTLSATSGTLGTITAGTITGSSFSTGTTGTRVELTANQNALNFYDSGNDLVGTIADDGGFFKMEADDSRDITIKSNGEKIYLDDDVHIASGQNLTFDGTQGSINCGSIDCDGINMNDKDLSNVDDANIDKLTVSEWASLSGDLDMNDNDITNVDDANIDKLTVSEWSDFNGDIDMNNNSIKDANEIILHQQSSGHSDSSGSIYFYETGGNHYFGSNNDGWDGRFDQSAQ